MGIKFTSVIFCDDIRREITNKDILIGVYAGDIIVPVFPVPISAAFWLEVLPEELGQFELQMRIILKDKAPPIEMKIGLNVSALGPFGLSLPTLQILVETETELYLEFLDGKEWTLLKSKKIIKGDTPQPFNVATASAPPA